MNKVIKISDELYFFLRKGFSSNTTLIKRDANILIDPGYNPIFKTKALVPLTEEAGVEIKDIDEIWFTHSHPDHTGLAYYLLQEKEMKICCHPLGKIFIERNPPIAGLMAAEKISDFVLERMYPKDRKKRQKIEQIGLFLVNIFARPIMVGSHAIKVDSIFLDGEKRMGAKIIFLPGHTPDEVGFLFDSNLITGDIISNFSYRKKIALNVPSSDIDDGLISLKKIIDLAPILILPGHSNCLKICTKDLKELYKQTADLKEKGISLAANSHSFFSYVIGVQKIVPLLPFRPQERLSLPHIIYKSYLKAIDNVN